MRIEFKPPPELASQVGENAKPGTKLELMGEFQVKENGDWCLVSVEGVAMPGYSEKHEGGYVNKAMENMPQGYGGA